MLVRAALAVGLSGPLPSAPGAAAAAPVGASGPAADPQGASIEALLLHASDADHAAQIEDRLELLRLARLSPTTRLMLRRAQREAQAAKLHDALADMDDALELQPDQAMLWRERATIRAMAADLDGAVDDLGGALSRDPGDILAWSALSSLEEQRGRPTQAYEAWTHVLQLDPMIGGGAERLGRLHRRMRGDPT